ncbi:uncharacterized protein LOC124363530 [Homalodisca vitripennis]|uniref:uncharacterized protein LOC124363530 n=1 Tax=Homalodisca vitripennis TaxID=197043 RepID=UPI001EEC608B|nr:uncharacterized protein LOC124363530 [Homalodisca vitripennis]
MTAEDKEGVPRFGDTMQIRLLQKTMEVTYMIQDVHKYLERTWQQRMRELLHYSKKLSHKRFKETSDPTHYAIFQRLRAQCTVLVSQCRRKLLDRINDSVSNNPKSFWSYFSPTQFFQSYLRGRTLSVRCGTAISHPISAESGVPQGSHLGPFLFNLFINDIGDALTAKHLLFADDVKFFLESSSGHDVDRLRSSLRAVEHWCFENSMDLNISKCSVMTFSRSRNPLFHDYYLGSELLHRVWKMKDLGVITTSTLHPDEHVRFICRRANSTLGFVFRFSGGLHVDSLVTLYKTLVRPLLEYNSSVWAPYQSTLISDIERVQVRFIRVVGCRMGYNYLEVPVPLLKSHFRLHDLDIRRRIQDSVLLMKLINGVVGCPELLQELPFHIPGRTRSQDLFERLQYSTLYQQRSTLPRLLQLGNEISGSVDFFSPGVARFRSQAVRLLTANDGVSDE